MTDILEALEETDTGLLITVDEVEPRLDEMVSLVTVYQHFVRENRRVSLIMAGLPFKVSGLISGESTSFLRRSCQYRLAAIQDYEVEEAFRKTVVGSGKQISDAALEEAAEAIAGFPFMMQLVGYRAWQSADNADDLGEEDVARGVLLARSDIKMRGRNGFEFALPMLREYLPEYLEDEL